MPDFAASDTAAAAHGADDHSLAEDGSRPARGHIGLIVLSSIAVGLGLGLVLDLLVFGGGREPVITGAALLSLAVGCAMLAELSARRTNQPQEWARIPAVFFGVAGRNPDPPPQQSRPGPARLGLAAPPLGAGRPDVPRVSSITS